MIGTLIEFTGFVNSLSGFWVALLFGPNPTKEQFPGHDPQSGSQYAGGKS